MCQLTDRLAVRMAFMAICLLTSTRLHSHCGRAWMGFRYARRPGSTSRIFEMVVMAATWSADDA